MSIFINWNEGSLLSFEAEKYPYNHFTEVQKRHKSVNSLRSFYKSRAELLQEPETAVYM